MKHTDETQVRNARQGDSLRPRHLALLYSSIFLIYGFNNVATSAFSGYVDHLGGDMALAGLQNSLFILLAVALRFITGPAAAAYGGKPLLVIGAASFLLPCLALPFCSDLGLAVVLHALQAVGLAAFHPNVAYYIKTTSDKQAAPSRIGITRFVSILSLMILPTTLFPLIDRVGYGAFFAALALIAFAGFLLLMPLPRTRDEHRANRKSHAIGGGTAASARLIFSRAFAPVVLAPFPFAAGYAAILLFAPGFADATHPGTDGMVLTALSVGGMAASLFAARLADRFGKKRTAALAACFLAAGLACLAFAPASIVLMLGGGVLAGAGYFASSTIFVAELGERADDEAAGVLFSAQQNFLDLGMVVGSALSGAMLAGGASYTMLFSIWAAAALAGGVSWHLLYNEQT